MMLMLFLILVFTLWLFWAVIFPFSFHLIPKKVFSDGRLIEIKVLSKFNWGFGQVSYRLCGYLTLKEEQVFYHPAFGKSVSVFTEQNPDGSYKIKTIYIGEDRYTINLESHKIIMKQAMDALEFGRKRFKEIQERVDPVSHLLNSVPSK